VSESLASDSSAVRGERAQAAARPFLGLARRELLIVLAIFLILTAMLTALKILNPADQRGDTAFYEQTTENIANRGVAVSSLQANILAFVQSDIPSTPAAKMADKPLPPPSVPEIDVLRWHGYVILYPIAVLVKVFPTDAVLFALDVLSFTGTVLIAYLVLRRKGVPVLGAALFCLLVVSHPGWSYALLSGQFYPDRLFLIAGFALMVLASSLRAPWSLLVAAGVVAAMVNERGGITGGLFLIAFAVLYWREIPKRPREFRLGLGIAMLLYGTIMLKFVITNFYYATFLPSNLAGVLYNFGLPNFPQHLGIFVLVNAVLLIVALFEWRAALIAVFLMLPNAIGNIGGAEKLGWSTHYHVYYLPALIWAAMLGYARLYRIVSSERSRTLAFYGIAVVLALVMSSIQPYTGAIGVSNISSNFVFTFWNAATTWFTPSGLAHNPVPDEFNSAVPPGSVVTAPEVAMPYLFRNRTVRFFPIDVDHADYAVLSATREPGGGVTYGGIFTFLGAEEAKKIDAVLVRRMRKDGYDFDHPTFIPQLGAAVLKRRR